MDAKRWDYDYFRDKFHNMNLFGIKIDHSNHSDRRINIKQPYIQQILAILDYEHIPMHLRTNFGSAS